MKAPAEAVEGAMLLAPPSRVVGVKAWLNAAQDDKRRTERAAARPKEDLSARVSGSNAIFLHYCGLWRPSGNEGANAECPLTMTRRFGTGVEGPISGGCAHVLGST